MNTKVKRKGLALATCLVALAVSSAILISVTAFELSTRQKVAQISRESKAYYLANSAIEIALAAILQGDLANVPKNLTPYAGAEVSINVLELKKDEFQIDVISVVVLDDRKPIRVSMTRKVLIKAEAGKRSLQFIA